MDKVNQTIENICDWINCKLEDVDTMDESQIMPNMIFALSDLVAATKEADLEKRIADLEGQVQSQQEVNLKLKTTNANANDLIVKNNYERQIEGLLRERGKNCENS